jgi:hypothetical protein
MSTQAVSALKKMPTQAEPALKKNVKTGKKITHTEPALTIFLRRLSLRKKKYLRRLSLR